jgi:hypothetical protein
MALVIDSPSLYSDRQNGKCLALAGPDVALAETEAGSSVKAALGE